MENFIPPQYSEHLKQKLNRIIKMPWHTNDLQPTCLFCGPQMCVPGTVLWWSPFSVVTKCEHHTSSEDRKMLTMDWAEVYYLYRLPKIFKHHFNYDIFQEDDWK